MFGGSVGDYMKYFERFIMFLVVTVVIGLLFSILAYRSVFDGALSNLPADWGAAGGFFGGIFTPIIAFATLIAIVITIQLQKQLLITQKSELRLVKQQALEQSINEQKKIYLSLLEQQTDIRRGNMESADKDAKFMLQKQAEGHHIDGAAIDENITQKERFNKQVQVLTYVSIGFALKKFNSIDEMDTSITALFKMIENLEALESLHSSGGESFSFSSED
jgi:uncharacterized membrane protein